MTERIESAAVDQRLDRAFVEHVRVDAIAEVVEVDERPAPLALLDQLGRHAFTDVAHRREPEADRVALAREVAERRVHVGDEHRDVELAALAEVDRGLVEVGLDAREQRGEVRDRMVRLQPRGLVRDEAVADAVRLVERVVGEGLDRREVGLREFLGVTVANAALDELRRAPWRSARGSSCPSPCGGCRPLRASSPRASATPASVALGRSSGRRWARGSPRGRGGRRWSDAGRSCVPRIPCASSAPSAPVGTAR